MDNFVAIQGTVNALVDESRGVQGPNQVLPIDILTLDQIGATRNILIGTSVSRVRENRMHGSTGGRWKRALL